MEKKRPNISKTSQSLLRIELNTISRKALCKATFAFSPRNLYAKNIFFNYTFSLVFYLSLCGLTSMHSALMPRELCV